MRTKKNIGLIECGMSGKIFQMDSDNGFKEYAVTKVLLAGSLSEAVATAEYPHAEIVSNTESIIRDSSIDLVIISTPVPPDMTMVGAALQAGKYVRVV